jgi:hypothetical protein
MIANDAIRYYAFGYAQQLINTSFAIGKTKTEPGRSRLAPKSRQPREIWAK